MARIDSYPQMTPTNTSYVLGFIPGTGTRTMTFPDLGAFIIANNAATNIDDANSTNNLTVWTGTDAQYAAIGAGNYNADRLYLTPNALYKGATVIGASLGADNTWTGANTFNALTNHNQSLLIATNVSGNPALGDLSHSLIFNNTTSGAEIIAASGGTQEAAIIIQPQGSAQPLNEYSFQASEFTIPSASGIQFEAANGTAANLLDDYEENAWMPMTEFSATLTNVDATYTKVGNKVFLFGEFNIPSGLTNPASSFTVTNMPFAPITTINGAVRFLGVARSTAVGYESMQCNLNGDQLRFNTTASGFADFDNTHAGGFFLRFQIEYITNA